MSKLEAVQSVSERLSAIKDSLSDLSLSNEYKELKSSIEHETDGYDLEMLVYAFGKFETALEQITKDEQEAASYREKRKANPRKFSKDDFTPGTS